MKRYCLHMMKLALLCLAQSVCIAQDSAELKTANIPAAFLDDASAQAQHLSYKINKVSMRTLLTVKNREEKIKRELFKIDSAKATDIFNNIDQRYKNLQERLIHSHAFQQYNPFLDTLRSSLKFLNGNKRLLQQSDHLQDKLDASIKSVDGLEDEFAKAEVIRQYLREEEQFLKQQLDKFGFMNQLSKLNKSVYYYGQQINDYKNIFRDPKRIERKAIDYLSRTKLFQDFMRRNSMLAGLFRIPSNDPDDPSYVQNLAGLQTRAQVNQFIQTQLGSSGPGALQQMQNNVQQAQGLMQELKNKVTQYGSSSDDIMPEGFKPSAQKTKPFLKRLEYGTNFQTQKAQYYFPVTSDIGLSVGYKLNDKSVIGIGVSYKLGLGKGWKDIHFSNEGAGLRSFIDWKLKGSFWITGGFEANYRTAFSTVAQLKQFDSWSQSALLGLSKIVDVKSAVFKKTKLQLLWDVLSYRHTPRTQAILFRIAYGFK